MVSRAGCCPMCVDGYSGEECTGGLCWDCQGTGHPHLGPCGGWEHFAAWCHRRELSALGWLLGWAWVGSFVLIFLSGEAFEVGGLVLTAPILLGLPLWVGMGKLGDRQMERERERSRR
jgi:hypothetical protein